MLQFLKLGSLVDLQRTCKKRGGFVVSIGCHSVFKDFPTRGIMKSQVVFIVFSGHD